MYIDKDTQREVIKRFNDGKRRTIIADLLGLNLSTVNKILREAGVDYKKVKYIPNITEETSKIIKDLYEKCLPISYIHDVTGITEYHIRKHIIGKGFIKHNDIERTKIVKKLVKEGKSIDEIAKIINWDSALLRRWMRSKGYMMFPIENADGINWLSERNCHTCGKKICRIEWDNYAYKRKTSKCKNATKVYFCCWSCMRKYDAARSDFESRRV